MQGLLDGRYGELRERIREVLQRAEFAPVIALRTALYRRQVFEWAKTLAGEGLTAPGFPRQFGGGGDPGANVAILDYRTHQRRLMPLLAKTYGLHFARQQRLEKFHAVMSADGPPTVTGASSSRLPPGSRPPRAGTRRPRSRPAASAVGAPATCRSTALPRSTPTRTSSLPSRVTTPC